MLVCVIGNFDPEDPGHSTIEPALHRAAGSAVRLDEVRWVAPESLVEDGVLDSMGEIADPRATALHPDGVQNGSTVLFAGSVPCRASGQFGFTVRVVTKHPNLPHSFEPGLVTWG